jgi:hypothetical protein
MFNYDYLVVENDDNKNVDLVSLHAWHRLLMYYLLIDLTWLIIMLKSD